MKRITIDPSTCVASGLSTRLWEIRGQTIEIADQPMASGSQGEIYPVASIDSQRAADLLVKIFPQGFPPSLRRMIAVVRDNNNQYRIAQCTALRALPLFLFTGTLQGQSVQGYVMRRVTGKRLSDIYDDRDDHHAYINLLWEDRIELCRQFVEGMHILYSLCIIHADLNGQNLMIDMAQGTLAIIDLDGGAVAGTGIAPVTIGKLEPAWLAPEIITKLVQTTQRQAIPVGITVDLWCIACGVHHLLFGLAPFFFMAQQPQITDYLARYTWPCLDGLQGITVQNQGAFDYYKRAYAKSPVSVRDLLTFAFQSGYLDQAQRPTAYQWLQAFPATVQGGIKPNQTVTSGSAHTGVSASSVSLPMKPGAVGGQTAPKLPWLPLLLFAVMVAGVALYEPEKKPEHPPESPGASKTNPQPSSTPPKSEACTFSDITDKGATNGTLYAVNYGGGERKRSDITITSRNTKIELHLLIDSKVAYIWGSSNQGFKSPVEEKSAAEILGQFTNSKCRDWTPNNSVFQIPTNIKFTESTKGNALSPLGENSIINPPKSSQTKPSPQSIRKEKIPSNRNSSSTDSLNILLGNMLLDNSNRSQIQQILEYKKTGTYASWKAGGKTMGIKITRTDTSGSTPCREFIALLEEPRGKSVKAKKGATACRDLSGVWRW
jgi:serine/threonine protein kinase